jgi:fumarate reductase flavoprotein subunit
MKNGLRIADEGLGGIYLANQLARSNDPLDAFIIVDEITWNTRGRFNLQSPNPKLIEVGAKHHCAHSIEDLAHQAGIDPESLLKTVQSHNRAIDINDFTSLSPPRSPQPHHPMPIVGQRFFAFPVCAGITYTFGGIKTNANAQVMRPNGQIIPGLFAVGSCTTGLEGGATCGYVGGLIKSAVMGLQAAQTIHTLKHLS